MKAKRKAEAGGYPDPKRVAGILHEVADELAASCGKHGPIRTPPEGYAVILEELDELWDEIKDVRGAASPFVRLRMRGEARQVAAMAVRFMLDVMDG